MKSLILFGALSLLSPAACTGQEASPAQTEPPAAASSQEQQPSGASTGAANPYPDPPPDGSGSPKALSLVPNVSASSPVNRFGYYMRETYGNPSLFTAPAFRASTLMAHPPGSGANRYPNEWRQGAQGFGRNYGDAFAVRISTHTAQFLAAEITREDPRYMPSASRSFFARTAHALAFTFVDRSDSGHRLPAFSNFAGAAAGGFVGNAYLPDGFHDATHGGQRATFQFGLLGAGNLFREFAPQIPVPLRVFISLMAR